MWLTVIQTPTDTHMGTHALMLTISFPTTPPLGFVFHDRMITSDYGFNISGFFGSLQALHCLSSTDLSQHWCYLRTFCMRFFFLLCLMLLCLCFPFIQPFITPQFPDLSCEPHWLSWCTDLSWVKCEIWIECMCEYGCEFDVSVYCTCCPVLTLCTLYFLPNVSF